MIDMRIRPYNQLFVQAKFFFIFHIPRIGDDSVAIILKYVINDLKKRYAYRSLFHRFTIYFALLLLSFFENKLRVRTNLVREN